MTNKQQNPPQRYGIQKLHNNTKLLSGGAMLIVAGIIYIGILAGDDPFGDMFSYFLGVPVAFLGVVFTISGLITQFSKD